MKHLIGCAWENQAGGETWPASEFPQIFKNDSSNTLKWHVKNIFYEISVYWPVVANSNHGLEGAIFFPPFFSIENHVKNWNFDGTVRNVKRLHRKVESKVE